MGSSESGISGHGNPTWFRANLQDYLCSEEHFWPRKPRAHWTVMIACAISILGTESGISGHENPAWFRANLQDYFCSEEQFWSRKPHVLIKSAAGLFHE